MERERRKVTFTPVVPKYFVETIKTKERTPASVLESLYWQTVGWVHTPQFKRNDLIHDRKVVLPRSKRKSKILKLYSKRGFEPKLQIEDKVPYGVLTRQVAIDIEKRRFARQNLEDILHEMGLDVEVISPPKLYYRDTVSTLKAEPDEGIPQEPFLNLELFDNVWYYEIRSPEEWLSLGVLEDERKPVPGTALVSKDTNKDLSWQKVAVLDYDREKNLYLVRKEMNCPMDENSVFEAEEHTDLWIPRIYLKFDAEESIKFANRLYAAVRSRHMVEETLRMNYYVDCMPLEGVPKWSQKDLDSILAVARRSRNLRPRLQWIKDHLEKNREEMQLQYKKVFNSMAYMEITEQNPCLMSDFESENFESIQIAHVKGSKIELDYNFSERLESFRCCTFYTQVEAIRALNVVESKILALGEMSFYRLPLVEISTLDKFETLQRTALQNVKDYIHTNWMSEIANGIVSNFAACGKGSFDLNQTVLHTFKLTKLGRLLKMVMFKMQDVIRFLVMDSLGLYATMIHEACQNLLEVREDFVWHDDLSSNKFSSLHNPIFEVPLEIKGEHLQFVVDLRKYRDAVIDLFEEGLHVTKSLPRLEKIVMRKMLYDPDDKLETVGEKERQIVQWKKEVVFGMDRAMIAATAYTYAYEVPLKPFKTDQINYVKQFIRAKATCDTLKDVIEMHHNEKNKLESSIPTFVDIGPFRLLTKSVRTAAIKKHEQLADAVLEHFYDKLQQYMERINDQFLVLLDRIEQPTGNIEDLLDKKQWCRTVPRKIEKLSTDVNRLRLDCRLMSSFHRNMNDEDFTTFWRVQELPQMTMKTLFHRLATFDDERNQHKDHLRSDQLQLKKHLKQISEEVSSFAEHANIEKAPQIATEVRRARKNITKYDEQAQLYNKRERLFGLPTTEYPKIQEISQFLVPYEKFWLNAAEFQKYRERDLIDPIEPGQLREAIQEFRANLEESLEFFTPETNPDVHQAVITVLAEIEEFQATRLS